MNSIPAVNRRVVVVLGAVMGLFTRSGNTSPLKPPLQIPFPAHKAGSKIEIEIVISEHREYWFSLRFPYKKEDRDDYLRVFKLTGKPDRTKEGLFIYPGVPLQIRLSISGQSLSGDLIKYNEPREPSVTSTGGDAITKRIASVTLKPGRYILNVESLLDAPDLAGERILFSVAWNPNSSTIAE